MDFDVAKVAVDRFLLKTEMPNPVITFMGGEPFLAYELIRKIVVYVKGNYPHRHVQYNIVTNGTLVHGEIQRWILDTQEEVQVILSLDSLGKAHDKNRCGSLKNIDLPFFKSLTNPIINTVVTPESVFDMAKTILSLHREDFFIKCYLADGLEWKRDDLVVLERELLLLVKYYISHPEVYPISMLNQSLYLFYETSIIRCGTDEHYQVSVSTTGKEYACHRCMPFENYGKWRIPDKYITLHGAKLLNDYCKNCFLAEICNSCPASNAAMRENVSLSSVICQIRRLLFRANAYMYVMMAKANSDYAAFKHLTLQQKIRTLTVAQRILKEIDLNPLF